MAAVPYAQASTATQVRSMRAHAMRVLAHYPVKVTGLRLLYHGFNTTFRVDTVGRRGTPARFALRINVNSKRTLAQITAEQAWLRALATDTDVVVPVPQAARSGEFIVVEHHAGVGRDLPAVLYSWLDGPNIEDNATLTQMRALGWATATLHTHAEGWTLPPGAELPLFNTPLYGEANNLRGDHPLLTSEARQVLDAALAEATAQMKALFRGATPIALHADLHTANVKWSRSPGAARGAGTLSVFDFDDSGRGVRLQDLATTAYYLRDDDRLEAALLEGYQQLRALPKSTPRQLEALVAQRNLLLLNDLFVITTADLQALLPRYLHNSVLKLRSWLDTGTYRHEVDGLRTA